MFLLYFYDVPNGIWNCSDGVIFLFVMLVEQELLTLPSTSQELVGFVFLDLDFSMYCFVDHFLSLCLFSFDHCIFCHSSVYSF
jgi:hypothetical protein